MNNFNVFRSYDVYFLPTKSYYTLPGNEFLQYNLNHISEYIAVNLLPTPTAKDLIIELFIKKNINQNTNFIFENIREGHSISSFEIIHEIINYLNLNAGSCYYISGALQAKEIYEIYCKNHNISNKINIISVNYWEYFSQQTFNKLQNEFSSDLTIKNKEKNFLCFNRISRIHRTGLLALLYEKNLVENSYVSYYHNKFWINTPENFLRQLKIYLRHDIYEKVKNFVLSKTENFPLILNNSSGSNTNTVMMSDKVYYDNSYFSVVTETFFYSFEDQKFNDNLSVFFSEKIFKPIMCKHPFLLVSRPNSLYFLKKMGYKTFHPWIDERYDIIEDDNERLIFIANEIERLCKQTPEQWLIFLQNLNNIVEHNYSVIMKKQLDDFVYNSKN